MSLLACHKPEMGVLKNVLTAAKRLSGVVNETAMTLNKSYSKQYAADVYLKREDLQTVRSYKIRGSYNKIASLMEEDGSINHVVCASAGNHAQGVADTARKQRIKASIFMPVTTPKQKIEQVNMFGGQWVDVRLTGDTFDQSNAAALDFATQHGLHFIHPFDDPEVIAGQATIALEILKQAEQAIDYLFVPVGGGGLAAGLVTVFKQLSPQTKIIGVEPEGAASMRLALDQGRPSSLKQIDRFVDGAAVGMVGEHSFKICQKGLDDVVTVPDGLVCQTILNLYNRDAIVVEPAGALSLAGLDVYQKKVPGKKVVCVLSGSNNDITRIEEIREKALLYHGLKHYFLVRFPQRAGALKEFVAHILGADDDITYFQYQKKHNRESGLAVVGIELKNESDFQPLIKNMKAMNFYSGYLNHQPELFSLVMS